MTRGFWSTIKPYGISIAAVALCVLLKSVATPILGNSPFSLFTVAIIVVAYYFGFLPGALSSFICALVGFFVFSTGQTPSGYPEDIRRTIIFFIQAVLISYICGIRIRAHSEKLNTLASERRARIELERTAQALLDSEQRYRGVIEAIPQIIFVSSANFTFEWFNDRWYEYTGMTEQESLGEGWLDAVHPDDFATVSKEHAMSISSGDALYIEYRLRNKFGEYRWHIARAISLRTSKGDLKQWFGTFTDIHDKKELEQAIMLLNEDLESRVTLRTAELVESNRDLQTANQELEAFCYSVSHDLRTPLRGIDGFARAVIEDYGELLPEDGHDYLRRVRAGARRMDELITALLKLSRIARQAVTPSKVNLSLIAEETVAELAPDFEGRDITFDISPNLMVEADSRLSRIIVDNLLNNAIKFSASREQTRITFGVIDTDQGETFFVKDNGIGFNPQYQNKLFMPFERLHSPREYSGSGIGLATVARAVAKHGGKVWAQSTEGAGATFYFTLADSRLRSEKQNATAPSAAASL